MAQKGSRCTPRKMAAAGKNQCAATTKAGTRCKREASGRSKYCASHKK